MAKPNGSAEGKGVFVSEKEMDDLAEFLGVIQQYLVVHESRIGALEQFVGEFMAASFDMGNAPDSSEGDAVDEPTDDSPQG